MKCRKEIELGQNEKSKYFRMQAGEEEGPGPAVGSAMSKLCGGERLDYGGGKALRYT